MKNIIKSIACMSLVSTVLFAQTNPNTNNKMPSQEMNKKMVKDINSRYPGTSKAVIVWDNNDYGYDGSYTIDNTSYIARYDKQGKYIETLTRKNWDNNVPSNIRNSFDNSMYKSNSIDSYWEVSDPMRKGYYIRTRDDQGNLKNVWMDDQGKVYDRPDYKRNDKKKDSNMEMKKKKEDEKVMD